MSKSAIIFHGTLGSPDGNWFPWLGEQLESIGYEVYIPKFPTPENQTITNWVQVVSTVPIAIDDQTVLVGHSSGCLAICGLLQETRAKVKAAMLAAPFLGPIGNTEYDSYNHAFNEYEYDWKLISSLASFYVFRGSDDPYVPAENGEKLAMLLKAEEIIIPGGKHLNNEPDIQYTKFPLLYEKIETLD
ncbi:alpha/beta hydrolase [candidate division WWE3 bacterium]|uniref:Alpha/beta hydrolase n=1 Tax=candidate division WWE3 bacterium TaxID=2053526 RepID=A0A955LGT8_UNCKA|nr:alpha/beta hydrolase [candidate division WWE3 bacterium]